MTTHEHRLNKSTVVFERGFVRPSFTVFEYRNFAGGTIHYMELSANTYHELGRPDRITVTIEPGDTLNEDTEESSSV